MADKLLWSPDEAAELLGVSHATMAKLLADGTIPSFKLGRLRRISVTELEEWVQRQAGAHLPPEEKCTV